MKHTKGEWVISNQGSNGLFITDSKNTGAICRVYGLNSLINSDEESNAKLIAAAPKLLEVLNKLYNAIDSCIDLTPELLKECNNAIKEATE